MVVVFPISYQSQCREYRSAIIAVCSQVQTKSVANFAPKLPKFSSRNWLSRDDVFYAGCGYLHGGHKVLFPQWLWAALVRVPQQKIGIWFVVGFVFTKSFSDSLPKIFHFVAVTLHDEEQGLRMLKVNGKTQVKQKDWRHNKAIKVMHYTRRFWYGVQCALLVPWGTPYGRRYALKAKSLD